MRLLRGVNGRDFPDPRATLARGEVSAVENRPRVAKLAAVTLDPIKPADAPWRRFAAGALWALCAALLLDLAASLALRDDDVARETLAVACVPYVFFAGLAALSAWRTRRGAGGRLAGATVATLSAFAVLVAETAQRSGGYAPPPLVWVAHVALLASLLAAGLALVGMILAG